MKNKKFKKIVLISTLLFGISYIAAFGQTSSVPISFTKKEIAFFKWGSGENEVGRKIKTWEDRLKDEIVVDKRTGLRMPTPVLSETQKKRILQFWGPPMLALDGNDNLYLSDSVNQRTIFISPDGTKRRIITYVTGYFNVDDLGNIYDSYFKKDETGFICFRPDGKKDVYKNFELGYMENGIAYDPKNNKSITIYANGDKPEKLPANRIFCEKDKQNFDDGLIDTSKSKNHFKKIGREITADKVRIHFDRHGKYPGAVSQPDFLGVDDDLHFYFVYRFADLDVNKPEGKTVEEYVAVYDSSGKKLSEIPLDFDFYESTDYRNLITLNIRGDIYQAWEANDGVHIIKWTKN